ncbi:MAG: hypothetical protein P1U74_02660 [Legionellaceae bacterium]|nr:hypothetical protein [Legionellaceae bacterium]
MFDKNTEQTPPQEKHVYLDINFLSEPPLVIKANTVYCYQRKDLAIEYALIYDNSFKHAVLHDSNSSSSSVRDIFSSQRLMLEDITAEIVVQRCKQSNLSNTQLRDSRNAVLDIVEKDLGIDVLFDKSKITQPEKMPLSACKAFKSHLDTIFNPDVTLTSDKNKHSTLGFWCLNLFLGVVIAFAALVIVSLTLNPVHLPVAIAGLVAGLLPLTANLILGFSIAALSIATVTGLACSFYKSSKDKVSDEGIASSIKEQSNLDAATPHN